jgi:hypothetical protein
MCKNDDGTVIVFPRDEVTILRAIIPAEAKAEWSDFVQEQNRLLREESEVKEVD